MTSHDSTEIQHRYSPEQNLYQLLFEHGFEGLMLTVPTGAILDANPAACRILGRTREEILKEGRQGLIDATDPRLPGLMAERERTGKAHGELLARRKDGSLFPIEFSSVLFQTPEGETRTCMIFRDVSERRAAEVERDQLIHELQDALDRVRSLSGLLPMCASCRRIRDDHGDWHNLETYIRQHTEADFSHGICPECRQKLYPGH